MSEVEDSEFVDGPNAMPMFAVAAAAVLGFTLQPLISIADPVALLITGILVVILVAGFAVTTVRLVTKTEESVYGATAVALLIALAFTVGDAWIEQRSIKTTCGQLQHIMLYEHRQRRDVPEIFRSLSCKIQG